MSDSPVFEWAASEIDRHSGIGRLKARGALRMTLKNVGLESETLNNKQLQAVVKSVLETVLTKMGIGNLTELSKRLMFCPDNLMDTVESPETVFRRVGR
jgi:hypothetical protein